MKIIEKAALVLFSTIILIISVMFCLFVFGWVEVEKIGNIIIQIINDPVYANTIVGVAIVFILLAVKCIFFGSNGKEKYEYKNGILLENSDGKLLITRETIENLVNGIVRGFDSAENIETKIDVDSENKLIVYVNLNVKENATIKELSTNLQTKIKETIKKTSDLEVKEVNIKVRNIEPIKQTIEE